MIIAKRAAYALAAIVAGTALLVFTSASGAAGARPPAPSWHAPAVAGFGPAGPRTAPTNPGPRPGTRITEDNPRWDCRIMGNRICGVARDCHVKVYSRSTVTACTRVWMLPQRTESGDGWESTIPSGPTLVHECQADNKSDRAARGCFLGWLS